MTRPGLRADDLTRLRLARTDGIGPIAYRRLLRRFPNPAEALHAVPELARAGGRAAFAIWPLDRAEREAEQVRRMGGQFLFLGEPAYPPLLALLDDAPPVVAVLGDPTGLSLRSVAVVGARNASANGQQIADALAEALAAAGFSVVSGMARGVDAAAHEGALRQGITVACVAGGLDVPYPPEHAGLQARISAGGVVVAEAPLGTAPQARHFPRRNRLIAGLALGVVVIEAAPRSGSLITARLAQDSGRELFAVPGSPLDPRCRGSNDLIRQGAHLTETVADILDNLPDHPSRQGIARSPLFARAAADLAEPVGESLAAAPAEAHHMVLGLLGPSPTPVDDLMRRCQLPAAVILSVLLDLELAGRVETLPGHRVALLTV